MGTPNYEECSLRELLDVERNIDKEEYPERYEEVLRQIQIRRERGESGSSFRFASNAEIEDYPTNFKYQTFWRRFWALNIDGLIFAPITFAYIWIWYVDVKGFPLFLWILTSSAAQIVYFILMHAAFGQTIGKMITRVIVLDVSESKLSYKQAVLRDIVPVLVWPLNIHWAYMMAYSRLSEEELVTLFSHQIVSYSLMVWTMLELITMLLNKKRRALHDFIAGSVVIKQLNE